MSVFVILAVAFLAAINERQQLVRFRIVAYLLAGAAAVSIMLAVALSIPAVSDLYVQRAHGLGDPLVDQQLGGVIMWVPSGIVMMLFGLAMFAAWLGEAERRRARGWSR